MGPPPASDEERLTTEKFFQDAIEKIVQSASIGYSEYKLMPGSADGNGWSDTSLDKSNQWEINLNHLHSLFIQEGFGVQVSQNYLTIVWDNIKEDSDP